MSVPLQHLLISEHDYLAGELESAVKHEYIAGEVYAMAGASINHQRLTATLARMIGNRLEGSRCDVLSSDIKVKVDDCFFYPDILVVCGDVDGQNTYTDVPIFIVEVLSKSTRRLDHTLKRRLYQQLPSLQEYVLIEQDFVDIEVCRRSNHWQSEHYFLGDEVHFAAVDLALSVESIYARVDNQDMRDFLQQQAETKAQNSQGV